MAYYARNNDKIASLLTNHCENTIFYIAVYLVIDNISFFTDRLDFTCYISKTKPLRKK